MDIETTRNWAIAISALLSSASIVLVWVRSPGERIAKKLGEIREDLKKHDRRIQAVEQEIKHLPSSDDFAELQVTVTKVDGDVKRIEEMLGMIKSTVTSIDNYLRANR